MAATQNVIKKIKDSIPLLSQTSLAPTLTCLPYSPFSSATPLGLHCYGTTLRASRTNTILGSATVFLHTINHFIY